MDYFKDALILLISGIFGSLTRLLLTPEPNWKTWLTRFVVGMVSAVFLGGFFSFLLIKWLDIETLQGTVYATSASGFIVGSASEQILELILKRIENRKEK